ncbi:hypothetical protein EHEL_060100 [Encephalitozoon hellem ATCC 50504]|uniref:RidL-like interaptin n=1 Tax=Encephalitozoon hellem TaxID=27973 RepID=A0A9Q9C487_ENCHE|nr:uncharacterized protein EHEL_060100 [Encephalitozoon hellem ATCC 50504]AFM98384.1 hypothetical protein EHEL_060100 [Encephalitozoon hellem ATCC 50504]UTX43305.1 RidL-like interaptin [Encephalitozoon hellem]WEL38766.1 RidL-like interaptin [Encephalitozoon hellem]|eukprot:XP_003887365.1 hypothetical protein EHEL_060100 [Encephalitozoon hellem ATCC 50504]
MLASSLFKNALTPDEQQVIPESVLNRLSEEMALYEEMTGNKVRELEKKTELCEEIIDDLNKKLVKQSMEMAEIKSSSSLMERYNEMYSQEIRSLKEEIAYYKTKADGNSGKVKAFEEDDGSQKMDEIAKEKEELARKTETLKRRCMELEKSNKKLVEKVLDQKNQMSYLLKKASSSDGGRDSLELVKLVQKLSKKNEELEKALGQGNHSFSPLKSNAEESTRAEEYERMREELHEIKRNGYVLELEYNKVFRERSELYNQLIRINEEKKVMQRHVDEMKEEIICLKIDLSNTKMKNKILGDASQKLNEMNNEIIRSNFVIKDSRNKIRELKAQLVESEERYNRYILENRTNVMAIVGREIEGIKKKLDTDFKQIYDIEDSFKRALEEQVRLKDLFHRYEQECMDLRNKNEGLASDLGVMTRKIEWYGKKAGAQKNALEGLGKDVSHVYRFVGQIGEELMGLADISGKLMMFEKERTSFVEGMYEELSVAGKLLEERDRVLRSLMENHSEEPIAFLEKERDILRQENIFLRNKIEGLGDSSDLLERISSLEEENEHMRGQLSSLKETYASEKEIASEQVLALNERDYRCRLLQSDIDKVLQDNISLKNELQAARKEISNNYAVIDKYKIVIEKLKKIKDAYLELKSECLRKKDQEKDEKKDGDGMESAPEACSTSFKNPADEDASRATNRSGELEKKEDHAATKDVEAKEGSNLILENKAEHNPVPIEDVNRNHPGRSKRTGRPGEELRQGHQQKRTYGDRKRGWSTYEVKRNKDRRN